MFAAFQKSLKAMASAEYVEAVQKMNLRPNYTCAAKAFRKANVSISKSQDVAESPKGSKDSSAMKENTSWRLKTAWLTRKGKMLKKFEAAKKADVEAFPGIWVSFKEYLAERFGPSAPATISYGQVFARMFKIFHKSMKAMSSLEFVEALIKMNLRTTYVAAAKTFCEFNGVQVVRANMLSPEKANMEAQRRLQLASQHGRPIADADVLAVLRLWPFAQNTLRKNVMPEKTDWIYSATLGLIHDRRGRVVVSNRTNGSEDLVRLLSRWLSDQLGDNSFPWTSISVNKNYAAARHRDKGNSGPSALRAVGDHMGGQLRYWETAPSKQDVSTLSESDSVVLDPRHGVVLFNGLQPHGVEPFQGERYSLVFFTTSKFKRATTQVRKQLKPLGIRLPVDRDLATASKQVSEGFGLRA
jgi:hypothetical protein